MTQYIGQITVILDSQSPPKASETLCFLAKQLDDTCPEVIFADHNGDIEDYATIERECEESLDPVSTLPARFDAYEIGPCQRFREDGDRDRFYYEPCAPEDADVWTLYGHIPGQGVEAIGDFESCELAEQVYARITGAPYGQ